MRNRRKLVALLATLLAATTVAIIPSTGAGAGEANTPNACRYSFDNYWRDQALTLGGTAAPNPAAAGQTITVSGTTLKVDIPSWIPVYGYNFGLLQAGVNELPTQVWVALAATNTTEGTRVVEVEAVASTTITPGTGGGETTATPISVTLTLPDTTWTATGGNVAVSQAAPGTLPQGIPAGIAGAAINPTGSIYVSTTLGAGPLKFNLDCQPGVAAGEGTAVTPGVAAAFETVTVGGGDPDPDPDPEPVANHDCISGLGRYRQAEVQPLDVSLYLQNEPAPATGGAYRLSGTRVGLNIPGDVVLALYRNNLAVVGEQTYNLHAWAAIAATNTIEGAQTVGAETTYTFTITDPTPADRNSGDESSTDVVKVVNLPNTDWTPTGAGALEFSEAPAGTASTIGVVGKGYRDTGYLVNPHGSIFIRAETTNYGANLDCVAGTVAVTDTTVGYSNLGRGESAGRYTITPADTEPFAVVELATETGGAGSRYQVITTNLIGNPLQLRVAGQLVTLPTVALDGTAKVTSGSLDNVTVIDPRGTNSGWNVIGQVGDLTGNNGTIPGGNVGWAPTASVAHEPFPGDTAAVTPGASLTDATQPWLDGLAEARTLCSAAAGTSGGTFECDATIYLGVPASAARGTYTGLLTLTLV